MRFKNILVQQDEESDCGIACLASIIKFYGGNSTIEKLRELSGTSTRGTSLLGLANAAKELGFDADGLQAREVDDLKELRAPAILHVVKVNQLQHYVVFFCFENDKVILGDPAEGVRKYSSSELHKIWHTKALLKLVPNKNFKFKGKLIEEKSKWILGLLKPDTNVLLFSVFIGLIIASLGLSLTVFSQTLIDDILPNQSVRKLTHGLVLVFILLLARSGLSYLRGFLIVIQGMTFNNRIIYDFYGKLMRLPKSFFDTRKTGELVARMNDTRRVQTAISMIASNVLIDLLVVGVSVILVFIYSNTVGLILSVCIPLYSVVIFFFSRRIEARQKGVMSSYAITESHYIDAIQGISAIKAFNKQESFEFSNKGIYGAFQSRIVDLGKLNIKFGLILEIMGLLFILTVFSLTSWMVIHKTIKLGEMVALLSLVSILIPSIIRLASVTYNYKKHASL